MRIALVLHAFPPESRTGVETYSEALARALAALGHDVQVFAPRKDDARAYLSQTREERGAYTVTWLAFDRDPDEGALRRARPGTAAAFARFLERERPEVAHFQHLVKLGPDLVDEARERGLVTVFTAHDPFAVCNDYSLLSADLTPFAPDDLVTQARNERARGLLDGAFRAHDGYLPPGCDDEGLRARLGRELRGPGAPGGDDTDLARRVARLRLERDARLAALSRCDRVEAPTAWLAELLTANGLHARVACRPCGHDVSALLDLPPVEAHHAGPLRALYLGGLYEHKGAHVLLEAAAELGGAVQVRLRGCSGSSDYGRHLAARAAEVGASLGGPFERAELPGLLEAADVVVLPSLWPENAPFVIREAFAAGRPVIASDSPPLRESIRAGVDGRLVPAGDAAALAECLRELASDRGELAALCAAVRAPKAIEQDARELSDLYSELAAPHADRRARARERRPAHLAGFSAAFDQLDALSTPELVTRALKGLAQLAPRLGQAPPDLARALTGADRLRERVADLSRAASWREEVARDREQALVALEARVAELHATTDSEAERARWRDELLMEREARLEWTESKLADRRETLAALEARSEELARSVESLTAERDWLAAERENQRSELAWTRECLDDRRAHLVEAERALTDTSAALDAALEERGALRSALNQREQELRALAGDHQQLDELFKRLEGEHRSTARQVEARDAELAAQSAAYEALAEAHEALLTHESWLRGELRRALRPLAGGEGETLNETADIAPFVARAHERLQELRSELTWRAEEMMAAGSDVRGVGERLLQGPLLRRVASWRKEGALGGGGES